MLPITDLNLPLDNVLHIDQSLAFTIAAEVVTDSIIVSIGSTIVYAHSTGQNRYHVTQTVVPTGTRLEITPPDGWPYDTQLSLGVYAIYGGAWWYRWFTGDAPLTMEPYGDAEPMSDDTASWTVQVEEDASCFIGPINVFEASLLLPFSTLSLQRTEELRAYLLDNAISRPQANRAVRWLRLRAQDSTLATVLRNLIIPPTVVERQAKLCYQRTNVELDQGLRGKGEILPQVITELQGLGLPEAHVQLCLSYDRDDPNLRVPLACVLVCLAKALEVNAIS